MKEKFNEITKAEHYNSHPSGIECIQIVEHMNFCLGNAIKYLWRAGLKSDIKIKDLEKAKYYINREIERLEKIDKEVIMNQQEGTSKEPFGKNIKTNY